MTKIIRDISMLHRGSRADPRKAVGMLGPGLTAGPKVPRHQRSDEARRARRRWPWTNTVLLRVASC